MYPWIFLCPILLVSSLTLASIAEAKPCPTQVIVNRLCVPQRTLDQLQARFGQAPPPGRYWYDKKAGLYGRAGGPTLGVVLPNLPFPGRLHRDASHGQTGVLINGRELNGQEVAYLQQLGPVVPGRYWMDAVGNVGVEGVSTPFVNLARLIGARAQQGGNGGQGYSWRSKYFDGMSAGSDGKCSYVNTPSGTVMTGDCN